MPTSALVKSLFSGKKEKWRSLYPRLVARLSRIPGIEILPLKSSLKIVCVGGATAGQIRVTQKGLEIGLNLEKGSVRSSRLLPIRQGKGRLTHRIFIQEVSEIDEEFLSWIKAAKSKARTSRSRPT